MALLILACAKVGCGGPSAASGAERFVSTKYGYSVSLPSGWHFSDDGTSLFLFNYSPRLAVGQSWIPKGGAEMRIVGRPLDGRAASEALERWISNVVRIADPGSASVDHASTLAIAGAADMTRVTYDFTRAEGEACQRIVGYFFSFHGRLFLASLTYRRDNARGASYEQVLLGILKSMDSV